MVAARALAPRLAVALLALVVLLALVGCKQAQQVGAGVGKAKDCATLLAEIAHLNLDPQSVARAAGKAQEEATRLNEVARGADQAEVRQAGENLANKLKELADTASRSTPAQREQAIREVTDAATHLATTCNVPLDRVITTS
jgi:hypothetical protein